MKQGDTFRLPLGRPQPLQRVAPGEATKGFRSVTPIDNGLNESFLQFPWQETVPKGFALSVAKAVSPWPNATVVVTRPEESARLARAYVEKTAKQLPDELRVTLLRGIGMFGFPLGSGDTDDLFE